MQTTKRPWTLVWNLPSFCGILPLGPSITQCPMGGGCLTIPYPCSSQKCARPSLMSTRMRWWSAPPLLRNGVPSPLTNTRRGETPLIHVVQCHGKHVNCKCPPNSGSLYYQVLLRPTTPEEWRAISSDKYAKRWNSPHTCGAISWQARQLQVSSKQWFPILPGSTPLYSWRSLMLITHSSGQTLIGGMGSASDAQM